MSVIILVIHAKKSDKQNPCFYHFLENSCHCVLTKNAQKPVQKQKNEKKSTGNRIIINREIANQNVSKKESCEKKVLDEKGCLCEID